MARNISEIKKQITDEFISNPDVISLYGLTLGKTFEQEFSKVSLESVLFYVIAFCVWTLETLFDLHKQEVQQAMDLQTAHKSEWYRQKILRFRRGQALINVDESDKYDDIGLTEDDIIEKEIVKYCAVNENQDTSGLLRLVIKVAGADSGGDIIQIIPGDVALIQTYAEIVRDAGVAVTVVSNEEDRLYLNLKIYRDPLVMNDDGSLISNPSVFPVIDTINQFLKSLPFNGELVLASLIDALQAQKQNGILIPHIITATTSWQTSSGYTAPVAIDVKKVASSGYFKILSGGLTVQYVV